MKRRLYEFQAAYVLKWNTNEQESPKSSLRRSFGWGPTWNM